MSQADRLRRKIERATVEIADMIKPAVKERFGEGVGFTLFLFTNEPGAIAYCSTAQRADMIRNVKEWLAYQEAGLTTEPPNGRDGKDPS